MKQKEGRLHWKNRFLTRDEGNWDVRENEIARDLNETNERDSRLSKHDKEGRYLIKKSFKGFIVRVI